MDMLTVEIRPGYFVKVRPEDKDRFLATHPAAKVADAQGEDKAEEAPKPDDAEKASDSGAQAPMTATEEKAIAPTEDKAVTMASPDFRPRRSVR